jgi:hypothetical protein
MDLPTTKDDLSDEETVDLLARVDHVPPERDGRYQVALTDREENRLDLTFFDSSPEYDLREGEWYVFEDAEGDVYEPPDSYGITPNFRKMVVRYVESPGEVVTTGRYGGESSAGDAGESVTAETSVVDSTAGDAEEEARAGSQSASAQSGTAQSGDSTATSDSATRSDADATAAATPASPAVLSRAVVDIETVATVPEEDFDARDSDHVELLCVGVGYHPAPGLPAEVDAVPRGRRRGIGARSSPTSQTGSTPGN